MSTPHGGGDPNQGWSSAAPGAGDQFGYPPPGQEPAYGQPDYSGVQPDYGTPMGDEVVTYASWGQRLGALLIDSVFLTVLQLAIFAVSAAVNLVSDALGLVVVVIGYLGSFIWFMLLEAGPYGQTPGKAAIKIRVQKADGRMLSKGAAVGRYFAKILSALPFYLGYLWPLWDSQNRTFHDMILDSRVVQVRSSPPFGQLVKAPFTRSAP